MIFGKLFGRSNKKDETPQVVKPATINPLDQPYDQPPAGVDPMAEKIPADPNKVRQDPGPGAEVQLPVDPTLK
jgi:hypothetical protein